VRSIALEAGLQNRKGKTQRLRRGCFGFALDRPAAVRSTAPKVRSIAPLQNRTKIPKKSVTRKFK
jgi:hypothetical protein